MGNKLAIFAFAFVQLWLSLELTVATYGTPVFVAFGFWGLGTALAQFSSSVFARKSALVWHLIVLGFILVNSVIQRVAPTDSVLLLTVFELVAVWYLAKILGYVRMKHFEIYKR